MGVRKVMRAGHRQGGGVGGCSLGVVKPVRIVGSEFSLCMRTHTHTFCEYPLVKPLEAKLLKELILDGADFFPRFFSLPPCGNIHSCQFKLR